LDETFEQLAQAKDNIEKNIVNTKELFESKKEDYFNKLALENDLIPINEVCEKIFAGGDKPKENFSKTQTKELNIPIVANAVKDNGLYGYTNVAKVTKPSITVAARGSGTGHTEFRDYPFVPIVRLIVLTPKTEIVVVEFLMYAIKNLTISRSGSAIPQLTVPMIKGYSIPIPSKEIQSEIIENLNQLEIELEEYKSGLDKKILELLELKKSILQKAFIGELTQNSVAV
jgi:type I restriction enzyme S subunit